MRACFLFWNVQKKDLSVRIARIVRSHDVDAVVLAESEPPASRTAEMLAEAGLGSFHFYPSSKTKLRFVSRWPELLVRQSFSDPIGNLDVWRLAVGPPPGLLLVAVHFPSKVSWSAGGQALQAVMLADDIRRAEEREGLRRSVLVGDLNMNPFEEGLAAAHTLNAVMTAASATERGRTVQGRVYPFFYNPMWGHFGDRTPGPPGTHYYRPADGLGHYWNMFDQVLVRPSLVENLVSVQILDTDGTGSLVTTQGLPDAANGSDHLPLLFTLDL